MLKAELHGENLNTPASTERDPRSFQSQCFYSPSDSMRFIFIDLFKKHLLSSHYMLGIA